MNSICFFASYFPGKDLPYYITVYLKELKKQFSEVVLLTSQKELSEQTHIFLKEGGIRVILEENDGFDFGLWYKAFQKHDTLKYDRVALVNDSCILFKPLDEFMTWAGNNTASMQGMTRSEAISPHLQSYFLIINKSALPATIHYFEKHKVYKNIGEVILNYEVGLSKYLLSKGFTLAAFIDNNGYNGEFSPYYYCIEYHLQKGIPLIKKKIMYSSYRKDELFTLARMNFCINPEYYVTAIKKVCSNPLIDFELLLRDKENSMSSLEHIRYKWYSLSIRIFQPFYKWIKKR